jgi:hypothetical protein
MRILTALIIYPNLYGDIKKEYSIVTQIFYSGLLRFFWTFIFRYTKNITSWKLDLFPSSEERVETPILLGPLKELPQSLDLQFIPTNYAN